MSKLGGLRPSAWVDLRQLIHGIRPAVRTRLLPAANALHLEQLRRRLHTRGYHVAVDKDGFVVIAKDVAQARRILEIDRAPDMHTYRLGRLLGYPHCCCRRAAEYGESRLESWAQVLANRSFNGLFKVIDPSQYRDGLALISHLPCAPTCVPSLQMAIRLREAERLSGFRPLDHIICGRPP
jgi:hypothetical protein